MVFFLLNFEMALSYRWHWPWNTCVKKRILNSGKNSYKHPNSYI